MPKRSREQETKRFYRIGQAEQKILDDFMSDYGERLVKNGEYVFVRAGMPEWRLTPEHGEELIITPETDIRNELVIEFIEAWQKEILRRKNPPPQPQIIKGSKKKDWLPVWKWARLHPQFTIHEIAKMLGRSYTSVKTKLEEIDKGMGLPFSFHS